MNKYNRQQFRARFWGITLGAGVLLLSACSSSKRITRPEVIKEQQVNATDYLERKIHYNTFLGKAQAHLVSKDQDQQFTMNLRMKKDQQIWSSIIAMGIAEVARASITPDSLRALVRIGKKAYTMSYQEGQQLIKADVTFPELQQLLIGNALMEDGTIKKVEESDSLVWITMEKDGYTQVLTYGKAQQVLKHLQLKASDRDFSCEVTYGKYAATTHSQPFAYQRNIVIKNNNDIIRLDLDFTKAELDVPVEFAFDIPTSYTRQSVHAGG